MVNFLSILEKRSDLKARLNYSDKNEFGIICLGQKRHFSVPGGKFNESVVSPPWLLNLMAMALP
jgi:hypothetical protein